MSERSIFLSALEISDLAAREAFLAEACAADPQLRTAVDALLQSHTETESFLETPAVERVTASVLPTIIEHEAASEFAPECDLSFLAHSPTPGSLGRLGHYEVRELLGRGAFGIVLRGFDEKLHRMVAIKVMNPELAATSPPRKRFLREARSSASIRHENIVAIHAVEEQPIPYLVMEYIPGMTLQQRLDQHGPLEATEVLKIGQQIAAGLAAAHAQGLIHRDIKPANILIETGLEDRAKITDFGLARAADDASLTQSGLIAGTPMYMAPEQAKGQPLDHRADLFSLGSVLYTMTSGRPPFRAPNTIAVLKRVCEDTPRPIDEVIPGTPPWLCDIIAKLLAKEPDDRFQSAKEVADVLGQHLAFVREPLKAPRPAPIVVDTVVAPKVLQPAKATGWSPTAVMLAVIAGVLAVPVVGLVVALGIPAYQAANARIPVLPSVNIERGLRFDGKDDYVKVDGLDWAYPQFTLEAFVTSANDGDNGIIALLRNDGPQAETMFLFDGPASSQARHSGAGILGQQPFGNALAPLTTGVRQHRALVFDGQTLNYYVNGVWQGKRYNSAKEGMQWNMRELWIGCKSSETEFFRGVIDQVRISRVARYTANFSPITNLPTDDQTLALYNFDESAGNVLRDASGHGHQARIFGGTWVHPRSTADESSTLVDTEWQPLFNGRDLTGWQQNSHWQVEDGALVSRVLQTAAKAPAMLVSERKDFRNFHVRIEAKINNGGDSGLFFRFGEQGDQALQAQLTAAPTGLGSLLHSATTVASSTATVSPDTWFTLEVIAQGPRVTVLVDDAKVVDWVDLTGELRAGPLALEAGFPGTEVFVRKVEVKTLTTPSAPSPALAMLDAAQSKAHQAASANHLGVPIEYKNTLGMEFVIVPKGKSWLGGGKDKLGDREIEFPADFYLGRYEVTQDQWQQVMGENPSWFSRTGGGADEVQDVSDADLKRFPVESVSWDQCRLFVAKLNELEHETGWVYRLPTQTEWEYACRGGPMTDRADSAFDFYFAKPTNTPLRDQAFLGKEQGLNRTHKVGSYEANRLGLFDMHRNVWEWCEDGKAAADGSSHRVQVGGGWNGIRWRSAAGNSQAESPSRRSNSLGLRLARVPSGTPAPAAKTPDPAAAPFTDADTIRISALPAAEQVEEVRQALKRLNPQFDGTLTPVINGGVVAELHVNTDEITNIAPVRALKGLTVLDCRGTYLNHGKLADLSPLQGMSLTQLDCSSTQVSELSALTGMPLKILHFNHNPVSDLSPLKGMSLSDLGCAETKVSDFSPLHGMPLQSLGAQILPVTDLTPLQGLPLKSLDLYHTLGVTDLQPLKGMPLEHLNLQDVPVSDLSALKGMTSLRTLHLAGNALSDLSPLQDLKLSSLIIRDKQVSDLSPLKGMPLITLNIEGSGVTDLKPLQGMPLQEIRLTPGNITQGLEIIRDMQSLKTIGTGTADQSFPAAEFWERYDKGEFAAPPAAAVSNTWTKTIAAVPAAERR
jgi:formylglycine-generating enzyme required for sulfatase activity